MAEVPTYIKGLFFLALVALSQGCFPFDHIFGGSKKWIQAISMSSRLRVVLDYNRSDQMVFKTESDNLSKMNREKSKLKCLESPQKGRYLVKVTHEGRDTHTRYRCIMFTRLSKNVVRIARTPEFKKKEMVDCRSSAFAEDSSVMIAYEDIQTAGCPLTGGFQLIMDQGPAVNADCKDTVQTYNPRIQFQCDKKGAGRAIADFGPVCKPAALAQSFSLLKSRDMAHLRCVGSWEEKKGDKGSFSTVLLNLRDSPKAFWCLHYKVKPHEIAETTVYDGEVMYNAFLTMDGRCSGEAFTDGDVPRNSSMFGFLASYRPEGDVKCTEPAYLQACEKRQGRCYDSTDCPGICHRCKKKLVTEKCSFDLDAQGDWELVNTKRSLRVTVEEDTVNSPDFGRLICRAKGEESAIMDTVVPVVQAGTASTCMPYYGCVKALSPAPGVLNFHLRPAARDERTGIPKTCGEVYEASRRVRLPVAEHTVTLLDKKKLERAPCNFPHQMTFRTLSPCLLIVRQCTGTCNTLNVHLDKVSCGNDTVWPSKIEKEHRCHAKFDFLDGNFGLLTSSVSSKRHVCWIVSANRLFITSPEMCNQEGVTRVMSEMDASTHYDPLTGLSQSLAKKSRRGGNNSGLARLPNPRAILLCLLAFLVFESTSHWGQG